jgi:hypothetical protein
MTLKVFLTNKLDNRCPNATSDSSTISLLKRKLNIEIVVDAKERAHLNYELIYCIVLTNLSLK